MASVRRIEPQDYGQEYRNQNQFQDDDRPRYDNRYKSNRNRRDDYRWDDWYNDYKEMMIIAMITVGIIVTSMTRIIRQEMVEMTGGHTKVTNIVMIEAGMRIIDMIIVDSMMAKGMIIDDPRILTISTKFQGS